MSALSLSMTFDSKKLPDLLPDEPVSREAPSSKISTVEEPICRALSNSQSLLIHTERGISLVDMKARENSQDAPKLLVAILPRRCSMSVKSTGLYLWIFHQTYLNGRATNQWNGKSTSNLQPKMKKKKESDVPGQAKAGVTFFVKQAMTGGMSLSPFSLPPEPFMPEQDARYALSALVISAFGFVSLWNSSAMTCVARPMTQQGHWRSGEWQEMLTQCRRNQGRRARFEGSWPCRT